MRKMILVLLLLLFPATVFAGEAASKNTAPDIKNIGFMENPSKRLKKKFPMCDAFLKVKWIDKEKKIGYSRYNLYRDGKKSEQPAFALIHLDETFPRYDYDLSVYEGVSGIGVKKIFEIIKRGEVARRDIALNIRYDVDKDLEFTTIDQIGTLADNRLTVCIPYPDNQRMWLAKGKTVDKMYSAEEASNIFKKLKTFIEFPPEQLGIGFVYVVDLNFDGIEDYFMGDAIYSYGDKYYAMKPLWMNKLANDYGRHWSFPPTQKECELDPWMGPLFLTTDGKNFFLNNQCNLTELTKGGK